VKADESYIRESVLYPQTKIVAGFDDIMPTFKGLITEDGMLKLVEYVKSLGPKNGAQTSATPASTQTSASEPKTRAQDRTSPQAGSVPGNR
jgi:cytochrome c oxidase subunit II